jgi:hypothetical protein
MTDPIEVRKLTALLQVSCCLLTDTTGVNHCDHPAPPEPSRWLRARWTAGERWTRLRRRAGSWVAGVDIDGLENGDYL